MGITLSDENGNHPSPVCTWQFNFNFDIDSDSYSHSSILLLQQSGIDFQLLKRKGLAPTFFAEKVILSGLVLNPQLKWVCYHGCYDFSYLLRVLMDEELPRTFSECSQLLKTFFPNIYDIKSFAHEFQDFYEGGGLNRLADLLDIKRVGIMHQAGSDSLVTSQVFFKLKTNHAPSTFQRVIKTYN